MKEIKAIIQPFMLDKVLEALHEIDDLPGCIVSQVCAYGRSAKRSSEKSIEPAPKCKLELVVQDRSVEAVLQTIQKHAHTGNKGDGKIFIIECVDVIRVRTGERGEKSL